MITCEIHDTPSGLIKTFRNYNRFTPSEFFLLIIAPADILSAGSIGEIRVLQT